VGGRKWTQERRDRQTKRPKETGTLAERELKRLGHVLINVDEKEDAEVCIEPECNKDFCKLGCLCKSLEVPMREEFHCGKAECIFLCLCSQAGASNCLFDSRVQDMTRNLAPEEKEFTNTVISKGSENLVVAERGKRERKMPHRLQTDFVTGEELESSGIGKKRHSLKLEDQPIATPKKRLLTENWDVNSYWSQDDRQCNVPSPDFLEDRCTKVSRRTEKFDDDDEKLVHLQKKPIATKKNQIQEPVKTSMVVLGDSEEVKISSIFLILRLYNYILL